MSSISVSGKLVALTYLEPGAWFGDVGLFDGQRNTHDIYAHGDTTILCLARADFDKILAVHAELYEALLRLLDRRASLADVFVGRTGVHHVELGLIRRQLLVSGLERAVECHPFGIWIDSYCQRAQDHRARRAMADDRQRRTFARTIDDHWHRPILPAIARYTAFFGRFAGPIPD